MENINYNGKNIALIGEDSETTIIDGGQNASVVTFSIYEEQEDSTASLINFTIIFFLILSQNELPLLPPLNVT